MFSVSPEIYSALSLGSRWLFVFFALFLLIFAFGWIRAEHRERRERFKGLPGAGNIGELLVIAGGDELPEGSWFPVPREGVLGSLRSCDLVVPCSGVRARHLDFSWQDGTGLCLRPRSGCEIILDGIPVSSRTAADSAPMLHGSCLQVGSAVLRLQLFAALDRSNRSTAAVSPAEPAEPVPPAAVMFPPDGQPVLPPADYRVFPEPRFPDVSVPPQVPYPAFAPEENPASASVAENQASAPVADKPPAAPRRKRADRWKEDWSE